MSLSGSLDCSLDFRDLWWVDVEAEAEGVEEVGEDGLVMEVVEEGGGDLEDVGVAVEEDVWLLFRVGIWGCVCVCVCIGGVGCGYVCECESGGGRGAP